MPAIQEIPEAVFQETITRAVQEVFKTMLNQNVTHVPMNAEETKACLGLDTPHVVSTVGFIGSINGLIYLYMKDSFAAQCAGTMLGMDAAEIKEAGDETVNDAIGEITNMTVGTFKNQLSDKGFPCKLTIPSIMRGSNFQVESITAATRRTYKFAIGGNSIIADLLMQPPSE
ncbi:MAG: chemotaxis protein CheX [Opitutus sp.]|nr:chemotaxis protein CheX [Opitutus sp.]MCS6245888.1 chemotaxis protein CheX [Opitutus sp.]MCS6273579.1 chemotaxis protein CheX [Opitutus sp.]MCS6276033.1 chemotaxis protein CheX [Opitutus sp.]MCS6301128.1 chemotaxis protein CheX [Opitutus sp.]